MRRAATCGTGSRPASASAIERGQRVGELAAGQVIDVDRRAGGQKRGDALRVLGRVGAHLERAAGDQLGSRRGDLLGVRRRRGEGASSAGMGSILNLSCAK